MKLPCSIFLLALLTSCDKPPAAVTPERRVAVAEQGIVEDTVSGALALLDQAKQLDPAKLREQAEKVQKMLAAIPVPEQLVGAWAKLDLVAFQSLAPKLEAAFNAGDHRLVDDLASQVDLVLKNPIFSRLTAIYRDFQSDGLTSMKAAIAGQLARTDLSRDERLAIDSFDSVVKGIEGTTWKQVRFFVFVAGSIAALVAVDGHRADLIVVGLGLVLYPEVWSYPRERLEGKRSITEIVLDVSDYLREKQAF
jgi:hypothetical protein